MNDKNIDDKKIVLLIVRKSYAELDWVLPVLQELKKNFKIYTYFNSKKTFENVRSSKYFFNQWKKFSDKHYTQKKNEAFLLRLLFYLLKKINFIYPFNYKKVLSRKINEKLYSKENFCKFYKEEKWVKPGIIFNPLGEKGWEIGWIETFKKEKILSVRYPHSTQIHSNYFRDKICKNENNYVENCVILTGSKHDLPALSMNWNLNNIKIVGYPRYEKSWLNYTKKIKNTNNIGVTLKNFKKNESNKFKNLILSILKLSNVIINSKVIFKLHPSQKKKDFIKILKDLNFQNWEISEESALSIASKSRVFLAYHRSSTILDSIAAGTPTIKLWSIKVDDPDNHIKRFGINNSIYTELGLAPVAHNYEDLSYLVKLAFKDPSNNIWIEQKKNFMEICQNENPFVNINKTILENITY